jgi:NAD(P)H-dependent FMN reductase
MKRLLLNGSPRGKTSNSRLILTWIARGLEQSGIATPPTVDLVSDPTRAEHLQAFLDADEVVFAFPLYTDAMPGVVMAFLELLVAADPRLVRGKRIAFVIQSGFPEAIHTETLADYLARLCERLGMCHLGTLRRGGMEGIREMPPGQVAKVAARFIAAGKELGDKGAFSSELLRRMAGTRCFGATGRIIAHVLVTTGVLNSHWDRHLRQNGAFERRFDAPYA